MSDLSCPASLDFGTIALNSTAVQVVTLGALSPGGLTIVGVSQLPPDDGFSLIESLDLPVILLGSAYIPPYGNGTRLEQGASATFSVNFTPTTSGSHTSVVVVSYNGTGQAFVRTILLTGSA